MPLFGRIHGLLQREGERLILLLDGLDEHLKRARRTQLRRRAFHVIAQDRRERLVATTGWRPPAGITGRRSPRHG